MSLPSKKKMLLFLYFIPFVLFGQDKPEYAVGNIPDSLMQKVNQVVRIAEKRFEVLSDSKSVETYTNATTIFNEGSNSNHVGVSFDVVDGLEYFRVRIYDAMGNLVQKVKKKDIVEHAASYSGRDFNTMLAKSYKWVSKNYPFTIEYTYQKKLTGISNALYSTWFFETFDEGVEYSSFSLIIPKEKKFFFKLFNTNVEPVETEEEGNRKITWILENLVPIYAGEDMPSVFNLLPILEVKPDQFEMAGIEGSMASWESYSNFMKKLFEGKDQLPVALQEEMDQLLAKATTNREKIDLIYQYVQKNTRYISVQLGDGGWVPFDAGYVYKNKYGDCKALTNYTYSLLNYAGIPSIPSLVDGRHGGARLDLDNDFVTPKFNHVILYVPEEDVWLECTSTHSPSNYLGSWTKDRQVLLIQDEGGRLVKTPNYSEKENIITNQLTITIDENGTAIIDGKRTYTGETQENVRYLHFNNDEKEMRKWFKKTLGKVTNISLEDFQHHCSSVAPIASIDYKVKADRFGSQAGKRFFVPINSINRFSYKPSYDESRTFNIESTNAYSEIDTFIYKIHPRYVVEKNPFTTPVTISSEFGTYEAQLVVGEKEITYIRKLVIRPYSIPLEKLKELKDFYRQVSKWDGRKLVFKEGGT